MTNEEKGRSIVVDFDDTLFFTSGRDWKNAAPNIELINRLNEMHDAGFFIHVVTARGSLSCETRQQAAEKYTGVIVDLLNEYDVKYDALSFKKEYSPIAYIDDKAVLPDAFVNQAFYEYKAGASGSRVYRLGDRVVKFAKDNYKAAEWYQNGVYPSPKLLSVDPSAIHMEAVDGISMSDHLMTNRVRDSRLFADMVNRSIDIAVDHVDNKNPHTSYTERLHQHLIDIARIKGLQTEFEWTAGIIEDIYRGLREIAGSSVYHGDMSVDNVLIRSSNNELVYIDPIVMENTWYSSYMDLAKFVGSMIYNGVPGWTFALEYVCKQTNIRKSVFKRMIFAEMLRTYKYRKSSADRAKVEDILVMLSDAWNTKFTGF